MSEFEGFEPISEHRHTGLDSPKISYNNLLDIPTGGNKVYVEDTDATSPAASTTETTLVTASIPGGTLGTNNAVYIRMNFSAFQMNTNGTLTLRFKYGSTTMVTITIPSTGHTSSQGHIDVYLVAGGATNSQEMSAEFFTTADGSASNNNIIFNHTHSSSNATEDSTNDLNFVLTSQAQFTGPISGEITIKNTIARVID